MDKMPHPLPEIMTTSEVADLLHVHRSTVHVMRNRGQLVGYKFGRRTYYKRSEILASITANPIVVTSDQVGTEDLNQAA